MAFQWHNVEKEFERERVFSSHLRQIGYDEDLRLLQIRFWNGRLYEYYGFPKSLWTRFLKVKSKGKFFWRNIRTVYPYSIIN